MSLHDSRSAFILHVFVALVIGACSPSSAANSNRATIPTLTADSKMLAKIFDPEMLGAQVPYFEKLTGLTAYHIDGSARVYKVGSCMVGISVDRYSNITSLTLNWIDKDCNFNVRPFLGSGPDMLVGGTTFGRMETELGQGRFLADCLHLCGNAYDPSVYERLQGSHALDFIEIDVGAALVSNNAIDASETWRKSMNLERPDYISDRKFNCEDKYDDVARRAFSDIRITHISLGHNLVSPLAEPMKCKK